MIFIFSGLALAIGTWYFFTNSFVRPQKAIILYGLTLAIMVSGYFLMWKNQAVRLDLLIILLLCLRIFFNLVVLPDRMVKTPHLEERNTAEKIYEITRDSELMLHPESPVSVEFVYYISTARKEILKKEHGEFTPGIYYIFDALDPLREGEKEVLEFESRVKQSKLRLSRIAKDQES
jgi:hypothetical protein